MDTNSHPVKDDLSDLERRLTGWRPAAQGLQTDAMLFAAGLAAARRGRRRFLAPALCGLLAVLAVGLGAWGLTERAERRVLAERLQRLPPPGASSPTDVAEGPRSPEEPAPADYLSLRRRMEQDPSRWLASLEPVGRTRRGLPSRSPAIPTPRQREGLFD
jgi:hypothetical protein